MHFLCPSSDLQEGQARGFSVAERALIAVRYQGIVYLYLNRCPHRGIGLEWLPDQFLDSSGSLLQCATHGALFLLDSGECVAGPCAGQALTKLKAVENTEGIWLAND
ncbi:Ferredoxin subunit of nitrite reductase or a ring-hydroxylating dioxygenase [Atopomonas hussainii]|uniref:Ferredoxin subunit of nitrite reductase or a ring-hydroxylating dioxygenase n=1 Tax=Atopomonas hussainii TaxID=1429083 RepID=A0A1H7IPZ1_9GAMM|nr:Rieske 2Fe-2S domain-containing protein [Atopomonas hussainii]SEK63962.1 Ferredoxin subunit of nitrite reductase or a ring-hydroxylating dioxygenase [Atopomonas hussainii]